MTRSYSRLGMTTQLVAQRCWLPRGTGSHFFFMLPSCSVTDPDVLLSNLSLGLTAGALLRWAVRPLGPLRVETLPIRAVAAVAVAVIAHEGVARRVVGPIAVQAPPHMGRSRTGAHIGNSDAETNARSNPPRRGVIVTAVWIIESGSAVAVSGPMAMPIITVRVMTASAVHLFHQPRLGRR